MQEAMRDLHSQILQEMRGLSSTEAASRYLRISPGLGCFRLSYITANFSLLKWDSRNRAFYR
jgi:hypothetical protein